MQKSSFGSISYQLRIISYLSYFLDEEEKHCRYIHTYYLYNFCQFGWLPFGFDDDNRAKDYAMMGETGSR